MPDPQVPSRSGASLLITGGMLSAAIVLAAIRLSDAIRSGAPEAPPIRLGPRESGPLPPDAAALASVGEGRVILAGVDGHLFLLGLDGAGSDRRLVLERVYKIRRDPSRSLDDPGSRSAHGWYLDDLAAERERRVRAMREEISSRLGSVTGTVEEIDAIAALADSLADEGEIPLLTSLLDHSSYLARRAAAIALGRRGYRRAAPALIEVAEKGDERSREAVGPILASLSGIPAPAERAGEDWQRAVDAWKASLAGPIAPREASPPR